MIPPFLENAEDIIAFKQKLTSVSSPVHAEFSTLGAGWMSYEENAADITEPKFRPTNRVDRMAPPVSTPPRDPVGAF